MAYRDSYGGFGGVHITPWVKRLLIANTGIYLALVLLRFVPQLAALPFYLFFEPRNFLTRPWTVLTYSFVHLGFIHLLGNMLVLFFFGPPLEERWGSKGFLRYYLVAAAGGAVLSALLYAVSPASAIIGASAATLGLMLAFAMIWPDMRIYIWGIFPVKAKWLVAGIAVINLMTTLDGSNNGVATLAHLGGLAAGFLYLRSPWAPRAWGELPARARRQASAGRGASLVPWGGKKQPEPARVPTATATQARPAAGKKTVAAERELLDDVDRILDKISAQGLSSLTEEERKRLDEVSRRYRTN